MLKVRVGEVGKLQVKSENMWKGAVQTQSPIVFNSPASGQTLLLKVDSNIRPKHPMSGFVIF